MCASVSAVVKTFSASPRNTSDSHSVPNSISVCALAGRMQSLCKQVINGSEHCSYGDGEAGGGKQEEGKEERKF